MGLMRACAWPGPLRWNTPKSADDPYCKKLIYELFKKAGTPEWHASVREADAG